MSANDSPEKFPDRLYFPLDLTRAVGLGHREMKTLKSRGCKFFGRKTTLRWVREFILQQAERAVVERGQGNAACPPHSTGSRSNG